MDVFGFFICVCVIMLFFKISFGFMLKNIGFYRMRFVSFFFFIELILWLSL